MNNSGDLVWIMVSSALVLLMTPGLAFFYGGLVRKKNLISTLMYSFISMGVVGMIWVLWGYSLAFGGDNAFIGDFKHFLLNNIDLKDGNTLGFILFQGMFAIITPALITGAFVERFKFSTYLLFLIFWVTLVYVPICRWVWADSGWLNERGALDFAGGTVVHINAAIAAIVAAWLVGPRINIKKTSKPNSVPFVLIGTALLWVGWFGFNAGSELAANARAVNAFLVTNIAAAASMVTYFLADWVKNQRFSAISAACGAIAGLVAITPAAGFVSPAYAFVIGLGSGLLCYWAVYTFKKYTSIDYALDVFAIHGIGGIWGSIATGLFALSIVGGTSGVIESNTSSLVQQLIAIASTIGYSFIATFIILKILDRITGLRIEILEEAYGMDTPKKEEPNVLHQPLTTDKFHDDDFPLCK